MNEELIDQIAFEAGCDKHWYNDTNNPDLCGRIISGEILDKFAELIVQECVGIVAKRKNQAIGDSWNVDEAMSMAEVDLLEHFGVE